jgi:DNA-binding response OmpR family regulator
MKQIDIIRTYAQKRCLVVDPDPEARAMLKRILGDFGVERVEMSGGAHHAIELCERQHYDLVLCDANLGAGDTGQQLLEELRHQHLLANRSLFILITGEKTVQNVLHAIEFEPDDVIQKPINRESLRPRLDQAVLRNEYLAAIKEALDEGRTGRAIGAAEELAAQAGRFRTDACKVLVELYMRNSQLDDAEGLLQSMDESLWTRLELAEIDYHREQFAEAETKFKDILLDTPYCVEAKDFLAKIYERTHRTIQSQQALLEAVQLAPLSPQRQRELGRISLEIDEENTAAHAYRAAIKHAKNSRQECPDDFLNLAESLTKLSSKVSDQKAASLLSEAKEQIELSSKRFRSHPIAQMRSLLSEADLHEINEDSDAAEKATASALELHQGIKYSTIENSSTQLCIDCAKGFMNRGYYDEGEYILEQLSKKEHSSDIVQRIDRLRRVPETKEGIAHAARLNKEGIQLYKQNRHEDAMHSFYNVHKELPNHLGLNLNLAQAIISVAKTKELSEQEKSTLKDCFRRVGQLPDSDSHYERYQYLVKRYEKLGFVI